MRTQGSQGDRILERRSVRRTANGNRNLLARVSSNWRVAVDRAEKARVRHRAERSLQGVRFDRGGSLCRSHRRADERSSYEDACAGWNRQSREEPPRPNCSSRHGRRKDRRIVSGPDPDRYSADPIAAPKVANDFAKGNDKLVILGGAMGTTALDAEGVKALAALPSLDELRGKLLGMIQTPATAYRSRRCGTRGSARARVLGLCQEGRSGVRLVPRCIQNIRTVKEDYYG